MKNRFSSFILIGFVFTVLALPLLFEFFVKVDVKCESQYGACPESIEKNLRKENNHSFYIAKKKINRMLKDDYLVSDFSLQFKIPNVLLVNLITKKPFFGLINTEEGEVSLIDENGGVLTLVKNSTLPLVETTERLKNVGEKVSDKEFFALKTMLGVFNMYQVARGKLNGDSLVVALPGHVNVIFPLQGESEVLLGSLRLIYSKITNTNLNRFSEIDLRFRNPVLR